MTVCSVKSRVMHGDTVTVVSEEERSKREHSITEFTSNIEKSLIF